MESFKRIAISVSRRRTQLVGICAFLLLWCPNITNAQTQNGRAAGEINYNKVVVPIGSFKLSPYAGLGLTGKFKKGLSLEEELGTGFCLDSSCRFVVTNYHVAIEMGAPRIKRQKVKQIYLATGPEDKDASFNMQPDGSTKAYAVCHDLALYEFKQALRGYHGTKFSIDDLEPGEEVDLYGYPKRKINPFRTLVHATAKFKAPTTNGLLAFEYDSSVRETGGASGGIVVQKKTGRIVGVLRGINGQFAVAVPTRTLLDFVSKVQPFVAAKTFPAFKNINPMSVDVYSKFEPQPDFNEKFEPTHAGILQHRPKEPEDVTLLRNKAQHLADNMRNFIAVQSYAWGSGDREPQAHAEYEVRVVDGSQSFRAYPDGKKEIRQVEFPKISDFAVGADEWAELPKMLGQEYRLRIQRAKDSEFNGTKIKIFQYRSVAEDNLCPFEPIDDYIFFTLGKTVAVGCFGEAWVDEDGNIIRISENLDLSDKRKEYRGWTQFRTVLTYGLAKIGDEQDRLVPLTIFTEGEYGKRLFWCRGTFSNYRLFATRSRLVATKQDAPSNGESNIK